MEFNRSKKENKSEEPSSVDSTCTRVDKARHSVLTSNETPAFPVSHHPLSVDSESIPHQSEEIRSPQEAAADLTPPDHLETISVRMDSLQKLFENKINNDSHKEKIIDELHRELQQYRSKTTQKPMQTLIMDIIKVIDDIKKYIWLYRKPK